MRGRQTKSESGPNSVPPPEFSFSPREFSVMFPARGRKGYRAFVQLWRRVFNLPPKSPLVRDGQRPLDVAIYQTTGLTDRNGRYPEQNVARFLSQALRDAGYAYRIEFEFEPLDLSDKALVDVLEEFREMDLAGEDVNLLIGDRWGGGWGGPKNALIAGRTFDKRLRLRETAPTGPDGKIGFPWRHITLMLHETGHTLGGAHSDEMTDPPSLLWANLEDGWLDSPSPEETK